jgi:hypothetical protein
MNSIAEKEMANLPKEVKKQLPSEYGCEILLEKTTLQQANDPSYPLDANFVYYTVDGKDYIDLCRSSKKVNIFDMYYDNYGPGSVKKIEWGPGKVNPKIWGYKPPESKRRK